MVKNIYAKARIDPEVKKEAEKILKKVGVTPTMAIRSLYKVVISQQGWPKGLDLSTINIQNNKNDRKD